MPRRDRFAQRARLRGGRQRHRPTAFIATGRRVAPDACGALWYPPWYRLSGRILPGFGGNPDKTPFFLVYQKRPAAITIAGTATESRNRSLRKELAGLQWTRLIWQNMREPPARYSRRSSWLPPPRCGP